MSLFAFPPEIRLRIYAELLVHRDCRDSRDGCIELDVLHPPGFGWALEARAPKIVLRLLWPSGPLGPGRRTGERGCSSSSGGGLCTAVLRVSRAVSREALPVLYGSQNRFRLPDRVVPRPGLPFVAGLFLSQIGGENAGRRLRHVCTTFPAFWTVEGAGRQGEPAHLSDESIRFFRLLRTVCTGLHTLELAAARPPPNGGVRDPDVWARYVREVDDVLVGGGGKGGKGGKGGGGGGATAAAAVPRRRRRPGRRIR